MVREDGVFIGSGDKSSAPPPLKKNKKTIILSILFVILVILMAFCIKTLFEIIDPIGGEYKSGVVFGRLEYVETDDSCGAWIYCYTYIDFYNQSSWRFCNPVDFVHTLETGEIYGFYYNSVITGGGISGWGNSFWDLNLQKIVDNENNVLWSG